ncbi:N-acetylmannosamine-6-phosphate 2-epimerase [Stappia stellulata]|uniref:N-acetylmannosamine-6-phosphate 2-epimerase n=1 Tax=Stappia stellulata TaxID=71235 RepID=UPI001AD92BB8|nr:N-acetylmannosamine-6-phosphate 2-epimerase [Stappia stellulata]
MIELFQKLHRGLVVSCQALPGEPLFGQMFAMARAAVEGGASGVLLNGYEDIVLAKAALDVPVIGVVTHAYSDAEVDLTPTVEEVTAIMRAGADMIACEATNRRRPEGETIDTFYEKCRRRFPQGILIAEVATVEEAIQARQLGFDCISTAAYGYTPETAGRRLPTDDFAAFRDIRQVVTDCPVIGEGGITSPDHAVRLLELGADFLVVGSCITRPQAITERFTNAMQQQAM